jgi:hypothetical protein
MILLLYSSKRVHHGLLKKISSKARQSPKVRGRDQRKKKKTGEERVPHLSLTLEFFQNLSPALFFIFSLIRIFSMSSISCLLEKKWNSHPL